MKTVYLTLTVRTPDDLTDERVQELVGKLLEVGQADAEETIKDPEWEDVGGDAAEAAALVITTRIGS